MEPTPAAPVLNNRPPHTEVYCPGEEDWAIIRVCRTLRHPLTRQAHCSGCGALIPSARHRWFRRVDGEE